MFWCPVFSTSLLLSNSHTYTHTYARKLERAIVLAHMFACRAKTRPFRRCRFGMQENRKLCLRDAYTQLETFLVVCPFPLLHVHKQRVPAWPWPDHTNTRRLHRARRYGGSHVVVTYGQKSERCALGCAQRQSRSTASCVL